MKRAFTLVEVMIVVTIIAITSVFSIGVWRHGMNQAEFDNAVSDVIAVFQETRGYAVKNMEIDGSIYESYCVKLNGGVIKIVADDADIIANYDFTDVSFDPGLWLVCYEAPYADFTVEIVDGVVDPEDLEFTMTLGELSQDIIVHNISGIAEEAS